MQYKNVNILLTEGYTRQTLPMAEAFHKLGCNVTTLNSSALDVGYTSKYPNNKIIGYCDENDYINTKKTIEKILKEGNYDLVVPMSDFTASLLAENKREFSKYANIAVNDWNIFIKAFDKLKTMSICMEENIPCPQTIVNIDKLESFKEIKFPVVLKPRSSWGSIGFNVIKNEKDLEKILLLFKNDKSRYLIQEYIPQTSKQYNAHMFIDSNSKIKSAIVAEKNRWFPIDGGASTLSVTVERPDIINICSDLLKAMGWKGYCDIDLILDPKDNVPKVIEINGRISANVKICFQSGVNIAQQILEESLNKEVTVFENYKKGKKLRYLHTDVLWFLGSKNRFTNHPSWFNFKNTSDQIFSLQDPVPWFSFTIQAVKKYKKEIKKRKRENY